MERIPVLLDTDIGSDIDDAVALAYLLRQPRCELVGITTVSGDVQQRAALAEVTCRAAGREDIPIHCGRRDVFVYGPGQPNVPQYEKIAHLPHRLDRPENTAVDYLRETIRSRPGEIVLLSIGPLSNIALLFAIDPEIPFLLRGLVSMAGCFLDPMREWNCRVDPVATAMVYSAKRASHLSVGLDVTMQVFLPKQEAREKFSMEPLSTVRLQAESWFEHGDRITFHDPLAAALIFNPGICTYREGRVEAKLDADHEKAAQTILIDHDEGCDKVAVTVDSHAFFREFWSVF